VTPQEKLTALEDLTPEWDGYGAPVISPLAIAAARAFLTRVGGDVQEPFVAPAGDGEVMVEWDHDGESLEFTFGPDGKATGLYLGYWNEEVTWEEP